MYGKTRHTAKQPSLLGSGPTGTIYLYDTMFYYFEYINNLYALGAAGKIFIALERSKREMEISLMRCCSSHCRCAFFFLLVVYQVLVVVVVLMLFF